MKDFLLDNVEEDSANRNEMKKNPLHLKGKNSENCEKLVNYEDEDEELMAGRGS